MLILNNLKLKPGVSERILFREHGSLTYFQSLNIVRDRKTDKNLFILKITARNDFMSGCIFWLIT